MNKATRLFRSLVLFGAVGLNASAFAFDYDQLRASIERKHLSTVEQVLAQLPQEMLANFTLVYNSRSLQDAGLAAPRAILFTRDAKLIITFNGEPQQKLFDELELIQWREQPAEFELYSIKFTNGNARFSPKNPAICVSCHGQAPHPIWGSYDYQRSDREFWPGFYGSVHDAPNKVPGEREAYIKLKARAASHPRYRHLKFEHPGSAWYPYGEGAYQHLFRPNNRLGNLLGRLNAKRIAARVRNSDFLINNRDLVLTWLLQCSDREQTDFYQRVYALFRNKYPEKTYPGIYTELERVPDKLRLAFLFEKLLTGLEVYTWNMSIATEPVLGRFSTGIIGIDQMVTAALLPWLANEDARLRPYYQVWNNAQVYDTFRKGYFQSNVQPGGVGQLYDELASHYDEKKLSEACSELKGHGASAARADAGESIKP